MRTCPGSLTPTARPSNEQRGALRRPRPRGRSTYSREAQASESEAEDADNRVTLPQNYVGRCVDGEPTLTAARPCLTLLCARLRSSNTLVGPLL